MTLHRIRRRRILALSILGIWLTVLGWHVRREYFQGEAALLEAGARALAPGSYFYSIRMGDAAIGTASSRLDTVPEGFAFDDNIVLDLPALDTVQRAVVVTRILLTPALALRSFRFRMDSQIGSYQVNGVATADSMLELEIHAGGEPRRERIRMSPGLTLEPIVPLRLAAAGALQRGREATLRVFDPSSLAERDVHVRVTEAAPFHVTDSVRLQPDGRWASHTIDTVPAWRIEQTVGGIEVASWVDEDGVLVGAESPLGFMITRTAFELARQDWQTARGRPELAAGYGAVIESSAIASNVVLDDVANASSLSVRLRNVNLTGLDVAGGRQELRGDTLTVRRESDNELTGGYSLPYRGGGEAAQELAATLLMQSEDARIVTAASEVIGDTNEPLLAARRLNDWVHGALRKEVTPSVPSALQVLEARRGDCNEHTVLFVAMARAVGLPARSAAGLVHVRGRFYYHAWPEVWLGERWVAVDPTLGQFPADASHLRFLVGGLARQLELIRLIGRLQIEVV